MGTKSITTVKLNGLIKVTQPHWRDGYPTNDGVEILKFLLKNFKRDKFIKNLKTSRFAKNQDEYIEIEEKQANYKGTGILKYIQKTKNSILFNALDDGFIPSVFDYGYLIDLDNNTFEIYALYELSRKNRNAEKERAFKKYNVLKKYDLNNLPTVNEFMDTFDFC